MHVLSRKDKHLKQNKTDPWYNNEWNALKQGENFLKNSILEICDFSFYKFECDWIFQLAQGLEDFKSVIVRFS